MRGIIIFIINRLYIPVYAPYFIREEEMHLLRIVLIAVALQFIHLNLSAENISKSNGAPSGEAVSSLIKTKMPLAVAGKTGTLTDKTPEPENLEYDTNDSPSRGMTVGSTTIDIQSISRMTRQVEWRTAQMVHFTWTKQDEMFVRGDCGTAYEAWDPIEAGFAFGGTCEAHPRLGYGVNYSVFPGIDVDTESKAVLASDHDEGAGFHTTIWYDYSSAACFFAPYRKAIPDSLCTYIYSPTDEYTYAWPYHEYQVSGGDTVTHVFAQQMRTGTQPQIIAYFRRIGSDTMGYWDYPPLVVDTVCTISQIVTASRVSRKIALVWQAPPGMYPGDPESMTRDWHDPGLGVNQRTNEIYYMISNDMGVNWEWKNNITMFDSTMGGWLSQGDMSALIDSEDRLHVVWNARQVVPSGIGLGSFANFWGSRLFHWAEYNYEIRTITDANWDITEYADFTCTGGTWNDMSICKPMISECDGKFYTIFVQYQDLYNGIYDDCAERRFTHGDWQGTANGELYISVSDNGGYNWDFARNLTQTYTPHCYEEGWPLCESEVFPSIPRFGMELTTGDFSGIPIVDPSDGYTGNYYLDVFYLNDKFPGSSIYDAPVWTDNPVEWFRVPCIEPIPNPVLSISPRIIDDPAWVKPGVQKDTVIRLENIGNAQLNISSIEAFYINGYSWLGVNHSGPINVSHYSPNYFDLTVYLNHWGTISYGPQVVEGGLEIWSDAMWGSLDTVRIRLIVADTVQFPEYVDIRTSCLRLNFSNTGNIGKGGNPLDGNYNMDYFNDCDTTGNLTINADNVNVYLKEASPFIIRLDGDDTLLSYSMYNADWLSDDGFRPLESPVADSTSYWHQRIGYTNKFLTQDSAIGVEVLYYAPTHPDTCDFMVKKEYFYNRSPESIDGIYVGSILDWDIPSDSGVANGSGYDTDWGESSRDFMYCFGAEFGIDSIYNNDCVLADQRCGGFAFYNGYMAPFTPNADSLQNPAGPWWTHMNADWVEPTGGFVASQLYSKIQNMGGAFQVWEAISEGTSNPDSMYQDLHMVAVYGQFDLGINDTLVFVTILASEYDGGIPGITNTIDRARQWIANRPDIFSWPERLPSASCCDDAGDANGSGTVNILDYTYILSYLYQNGPAPECLAEGDVNGSGQSWETPEIDLRDLTHLIRYFYCGGPAPICPPEFKLSKYNEGRSK